MRPDFSDHVLTWASDNKRKFPWRDFVGIPYPILLAEILLKRTTATAVGKQYPSVFSKYPTLYHLSKATLSDLERCFEPLGLHQQRANSTLRLVEHLVDKYEGNIPDNLDQLLSVPGIGPYSARAILSFGFGHKYAVVDGNVQRILNRVNLGESTANSGAKHYQALADQLVPNNEHREFNFGMIDLGSMICRPTKPKCSDCPMQQMCDFAKDGAVEPELIDSSHQIKKRRSATKMGLVQLATLSGVSKLTIINIEKGRTKPRPVTIKKLSRVLG